MRSSIVCGAALVLALGAGARAQQAEPTFFVTSVGLGNGADLGGLEGADAWCQELADASGAGNHTWRAYLSTQEAGGEPAVDARDRIGQGPWQNAAGIVIATDLAVLHGDNNLDKSTALNERGEQVNGRGDSPNRHDILTGSQPDGTAFAPRGPHLRQLDQERRGGSAMVGHHDRMGLRDDAASRSLARLQPGSPDRHRRRRPVLLLRRRLTASGARPHDGRTTPCRGHADENAAVGMGRGPADRERPGRGDLADPARATADAAGGRERARAGQRHRDVLRRLRRG